MARGVAGKKAGRGSCFHYGAGRAGEVKELVQPGDGIYSSCSGDADVICNCVKLCLFSVMLSARVNADS